MSGKPTIHRHKNIKKLVARLRDDLRDNTNGGADFVLLYAYKGTGNPRLLLKRRTKRIKTVISSHHSLFFNVMCNELKKTSHKTYFLYPDNGSDTYTLRATDDTPFFHHVAMLAELQKTSESGKLYTHHFNMLRSILEKTATFFGFNDFSVCIHGIDDEVLFARALNLLSHGKYSAYEPKEMGEDTKQLFQRILGAFLGRYQFDLPEMISETASVSSADHNQ
jgi:hypothetical protein